MNVTTISNHSEPRTAPRWLELGARILAESGIESAALDASLLLAGACGAERARLLAGLVDVGPAQASRFKAMLARRAAREPVAYILGHKEFFSLEFLVSRDTLIPRPETETLVEAALSWARTHRVARVIDLCTGCGAIALALARHMPGTRVAATDISEPALAVARRNARQLGLGERVEFYCGDLWYPLEPLGEKLEPFDMVVANPPYVAENDFDRLAPEIRGYEPKIALVAGNDGLAYYREILRGAPRFLRAGGYVAFEVGLGQADSVAQIFSATGARTIYRFRDLAGFERVVAASF